MKQFSIFLFFIFIVNSESFTQQQPDTIPVVMINEVKDNVFSGVATETNLTDTKIVLKSLPAHITKFRIKKLSLDSSLQDLYVFYGLNQANKRIVIFDSDFDGDLKNEINYVFEADVTYRRDIVRTIMDSIPPVEIKYPGMSSIFFKPSVFNCCIRYASAEDSVWHLELHTSYYRRGIFKLGEEIYSVALSGYSSPVFKGYPGFYVNKGMVLSENERKDSPYKIKQTVYIDRGEFVINAVSKYGDTVWIIYKGVVDSAFGGRVGLFAKNIHSETLENKSFDLASLRGNFVLLDFWGTWCGPCIELIPDLVRLNDKYKRKLNLVSIAYDKKENIKKLKEIVKNKHMDWMHLFTDQDSLDNISNQYDVSCYPTSILINPEGVIVYRGCGQQNFNELLDAIDHYINPK